MALTGKQKAAMLLMGLDAATAAQLVKGLGAEEIEEIAIELARIKASGQRSAKEQAKIIQEFYSCLGQEQNRHFNLKVFLNEVLTGVLDKNRAEQIKSQVRKATEKKDIFMDIRSAGTDELILALEGQHPQTVAVVLSELPPKKSQEVLQLLNEEARLRAVCRMTNPEPLGAGVRQRIASIVSERLKTLEGQTIAVKPELALRKLALMLSGLEKDLRNKLLDEIGKQDEQTSAKVKSLMVTWEDIPSIADRSLQEALRSAEPGKLAVALYGASEEIAQKIRSNISERASATLDEEASLMQEPLEKEVLEARDEIVAPLREANEEDKLRFVGR